MGIKVKARYENKVLKPLEGLDLEAGEEVEIEVKERKLYQRNIILYVQSKIKKRKEG